MFYQFFFLNSFILHFQPEGEKHRLDDYSGIDLLGNMMESSLISIDRDYYGDIHNMGHIFMAFAHDPQHRHVRQFHFYFLFYQLLNLFILNY